MDSIKSQNVGYWSQNVPGLDGTPEERVKQRAFFEEVDRVRFANEPYLSAMLDALAAPGQDLLEIGFGLGTDLRHFARRGMRVWGLDFSPENAFKVATAFQLMELPGRIASGDAEHLPFPDQAFDRVHSWGVLHHTPDTDRTLAEVMRVLKPGGRFMIMLYHKGYQYAWLRLTYAVCLHWMRKSLEKHISDGYDQSPLSKMYSVGELRCMFRAFEEVRIEIVTFGGIQHHPVLKWVWRLFNRVPFLMRRFGSFAVITGRKPEVSAGGAAVPEWRCARCRGALVEEETGWRCSEAACAMRYPRYKDAVPVLHPDSADVIERLSP